MPEMGIEECHHFGSTPSHFQRQKIVPGHFSHFFDNWFLDRDQWLKVKRSAWNDDCIGNDGLNFSRNTSHLPAARPASNASGQGLDQNG